MEEGAIVKIEITLDHTDLIGSSAENFCAFMYILQGLAKANPLHSGIKPFMEPMPNFPEQKIIKETPEKEEKVVMDREAIITEIKKIAAEGKETNKSARIKELLQEQGYKKLSEVPDEKLMELCEKVRAL